MCGKNVSHRAVASDLMLACFVVVPWALKPNAHLTAMPPRAG